MSTLMEDIVRLLPESLANQIAAGEVVQRPASVVKELLENSVDAGSTKIDLVIKDAGKTLIQVIDNGCGMSETDARMCFERHATSKIKDSTDLFNIHTFGFRGEAMASIAAVAQVNLKTKRAADELGVEVEIEGSKVKRQEPCATATGTNFQIKNLFFNIPARRNFLKSNSVEFKHIIDEFQRVALANPHIDMSFYHDEREVFNLKASSVPKRIISMLGKNLKEQMLTCSEEIPNLKVTGYIGKPQTAKKTRGDQYFFVNNRFIKHQYLHHAIMKVYEGLIPENSFPFYLLFIEMDPAQIDVNVHPTKTEVKFEDERTLYSIVESAAKQAIASFGVTPSIDFDIDVNFTSKTSSSSDLINSVSNEQLDPMKMHTFQSAMNEKDQQEEMSIEEGKKEAVQRGRSDIEAKKEQLESWTVQLSSKLNDLGDEKPREFNNEDHNAAFQDIEKEEEPVTSEKVSITFASRGFDDVPDMPKEEEVQMPIPLKEEETIAPVSNTEKVLKEEAPVETPKEEFRVFQSAANTPQSGQGVQGNDHFNEVSKSKYSIQIQNKYILYPVKSGVMLIDQEAAMERMYFDRLVNRLNQGQDIQAQKVLFPLKLELNSGDFALLMEIRDELSRLGLLYEEAGENTVKIIGVPSNLDIIDEKELIEGFLEQFKQHGNTDQVQDISMQSVRVLAKRAAGRRKKALNQEEITALIDQLFTSSNPNYAPDGKKTINILTPDKLAELL